MFAIGHKADMPFCTAQYPLMTQSGHGDVALSLWPLEGWISKHSARL